jgi:outer membrane protein assembly factor BamB
VLLVAVAAYAEPVQEWQVSAQPSLGSFVVAESATDAAGDLYVAGTVSDSTGSQVMLIKLDARGRVRWRQSWGDPAALDHANALAVDPSGNAFVAAATVLPGSLDRDFVLLAWAPDGTLSWQARVDGGTHGADWANDVAVGGGLVVITGSTAGAHGTDYLTLGFASNGSLRWRAQWDSGEDDAPADFGQSLVIDPQGNSYVAGESGVVAYDAGGNQRWALAERAEAIALAPDGTLYTTAPQQTLRLDANGDLRWRALGLGGVSIAANASGVWTAGTAFTSPTTSDVRTRAFGTEGQLRWDRTLDLSANDLEKRLALDAAGNVYLLAESWLPTGLFQTKQPVAQLVKYDPQGIPVWTASSSAMGDPGAFALDGAAEIYATGLGGVTVKWREGAACPWWAFWCL